MTRFLKDSPKYTNCWFEVKTVNGVCYTPFTKGKYIHEFAGDGSKEPTPKEIVDFLESDDKKDWFYEDTVFKHYSSEEASGNPVKLPSGVYEHYQKEDELKERLVPFSLRTDGFVSLDKVHEKIQNDIESFINNKKLYNKHQLFYKLGLLFYGSPGNGKSFRLRQIIKYTIEKNKDLIVIFVNNKIPSNSFLNSVKETLSDRLKIFVFEELLCSTEREHQIENLLNFLDGELSTENTIILSTTNYPEKLPGNIVDRPSRFDKLYHFDNPTAKEREKLINFFLQRTPLEEDVKVTDGLSIAAIKEVCLQHLLNNKEITQACKEMKDRQQLIKKAFARPTKEMGFGLSSSNSCFDED